VTGAQVKMTNVNTGASHLDVTGADGSYTFPSLEIGPYILDVTSSGFETYERKGLNLQVNDALEINVSLKVGAVADKVEVQADASMVQTQ
jgi:hypothetical protein